MPDDDDDVFFVPLKKKQRNNQTLKAGKYDIETDSLLNELKNRKKQQEDLVKESKLKDKETKVAPLFHDQAEKETDILLQQIRDEERAELLEDNSRPPYGFITSKAVSLRYSNQLLALKPPVTELCVAPQHLTVKQVELLFAGVFLSTSARIAHEAYGALVVAMTGNPSNLYLTYRQLFSKNQIKFVPFAQMVDWKLSLEVATQVLGEYSCLHDSQSTQCDDLRENGKWGLCLLTLLVKLGYVTKRDMAGLGEQLLCFSLCACSRHLEYYIQRCLSELCLADDYKFAQQESFVRNLVNLCVMPTSPANEEYSLPYSDDDVQLHRLVRIIFILPDDKDAFRHFFLVMAAKHIFKKEVVDDATLLVELCKAFYNAIEAVRLRGKAQIVDYQRWLSMARLCDSLLRSGRYDNTLHEVNAELSKADQRIDNQATRGFQDLNDYIRKMIEFSMLNPTASFNQKTIISYLS